MKIGLDVLASIDSELDNRLGELGEIHKDVVAKAEYPGRVTGAIRRCLDELTAIGRAAAEAACPKTLAEAMEIVSGGDALTSVECDFLSTESVERLEERIGSETASGGDVNRVTSAVIAAAKAATTKAMFEAASAVVASEALSLAGDAVDMLRAARETIPSDAVEVTAALERALQSLTKLLFSRGADVSTKGRTEAKPCGGAVGFLKGGSGGTGKKQDDVEPVSVRDDEKTREYARTVVEISEKILKDKRTRLLGNDGGVVEEMVKEIKTLSEMFSEKKKKRAAVGTARKKSPSGRSSASRVATVLKDAEKELPPKLGLWAETGAVVSAEEDGIEAAV